MIIADIQRFCMHDGPGVRTTIFLKGCPLRCVWCHNPETQKTTKELLLYESKCIGCGVCQACKQDVHCVSQSHTVRRDLCICCGECASNCPTNALELVGKDYTIQQLLESAEKDRAFYGERGGVTLSGGEPFMQAEETVAFLKLCKNSGIHTAVETCGYTTADAIKKVAPFVDLFLWDIKDTDSARHEKYTGVPNERIISNLKLADSLGAKSRMRCILINGINTNEEHYEKLSAIAKQLKYCEGVEFMPYHSFGGAKTAALGKQNRGEDRYIPTKEQQEAAKEYLRDKNIVVY